MTKTIKTYGKNAKQFFKEYESVSASEVHKSWTELIPYTGGVALDIGAGSGRDAAYLVGRGFEVVAVEPSSELRQLAQQAHTSGKIHWINDSLPELRDVEKLNFKFDLILLSAVWMHIPHKQRARAFRKIANLLKPSGQLIITLRHGKSQDERVMHDVSFDEVMEFSRNHSLKLELHSDDNDSLKRPDVYWETLVFKLPDDGTGALPLLRNIIINDAKSSTYKLALLRTIIRIADSYPGMVIKRDEKNITLPLGAVALVWIRMYKKLIQDHGIPQTSNPAKGLGFIKQGFKQLQTISSMDLRLGQRYSGSIGSALVSAINDAKHTIIDYPSHYITDPVRDLQIFSGLKATVRARKSFTLDKEFLSTFGEFYVPVEIWDAASQFACWIEPAIIEEWIKIMQSYDQSREQSRDTMDYRMALKWDEPQRCTTSVRKIVDKQLNSGNVECIWTGMSLAKSPYEIDHCLPFAVWTNNDLWNLFPTHHKVNSQKRDMLPSAELLLKAKDRIFDWWDTAYRTPSLEEQFYQEARATLPFQKQICTPSNLELFAALNIQRIRLKDSQQVKEWQPTT